MFIDLNELSEVQNQAMMLLECNLMLGRFDKANEVAFKYKLVWSCKLHQYFILLFFIMKKR